MTQSITHRYIERSGEHQMRSGPILAEHALHIQIENGPALDFVCMPKQLTELVAGHLLTEGYIRCVDEVKSLTIDESGSNGTVALAESCPREKRTLAPLPVVSWEIEQVFQLADAFAGEMPLHNLTFAAHSCFLAHKGVIVFACEDIGRHNALDKAVGHALLHGFAPEDCMLYSSGRMPIDMVSKAIRAGFPVLISKGSPTAGAVALAREYGLTLICSARRDGVKVFSENK